MHCRLEVDMSISIPSHLLGIFCTTRRSLVLVRWSIALAGERTTCRCVQRRCPCGAGARRISWATDHRASGIRCETRTIADVEVIGGNRVS